MSKSDVSAAETPKEKIELLPQFADMIWQGKVIKDLTELELKQLKAKIPRLFVGYVPKPKQ